MTIASAGPFWVPPPQYDLGLAGTAGFALNAAGDKFGWVFRAPKTGNIHRVGFRTGTVTTPTNTDVRLETVASQIPSGTLFGTNTNGTIASASVTANTFVFATMTADAAVTIGQLMAISVVPTGSPNYQVAFFQNMPTTPQLPYPADGSSGTYAPSNVACTFAVEYDDGSYATMPGVFPWSSVAVVTFNSGSNPEIVGLKFKFANTPVRVSGGWFMLDLDNSMDIVLYDSDGTTPLQTASLTNAGRSSTGGVSPYFFKFPASQSLLANTFYYLAAKPGASNISVYTFTVPTAPVLDQTEGGQNFHYATRHSTTWTPVTASRPLMGLEIDGIDDGSPAPHLVVIG